jgi:hypothetical protein
MHLFLPKWPKATLNFDDEEDFSVVSVRGKTPVTTVMKRRRQGIVAGINAVRYVRHQEMVVFPVRRAILVRRIDDLCTKRFTWTLSDADESLWVSATIAIR